MMMAHGSPDTLASAAAPVSIICRLSQVHATAIGQFTSVILISPPEPPALPAPLLRKASFDQSACIAL